MLFGQQKEGEMAHLICSPLKTVPLSCPLERPMNKSKTPASHPPHVTLTVQQIGADACLQVPAEGYSARLGSWTCPIESARLAHSVYREDVEDRQ
ncbi:hypothetical protein GYMLUDRAFT_375309 [Collybiopsis luxurians FD-317 M1]|uniref:Uncharacterized protein n=1 Tax=Collybiopsis luxurians FD-317 M1 TaxID=944289 RepID=A0A0D0C2F8_9AGAR|nr:hypothetical protein GYMLUDRAFT_375309 [Collybiopsis luxurians FD-317 M1]